MKAKIRHIRFSVVFFLVICLTIPGVSLFSQSRSVTALFPRSSTEQLGEALLPKGYLYYGTRKESPTLLPETPGTIFISKASLGPNPGFFVEALRIVPRKNINPLSVYQALEKIQGLKGKTYHSVTRNRDIPLFEDAVRIEGPKKTRVFLPDPPPAQTLPPEETMYVRLTDANFGHCYYEISLKTSQEGILCKIINVKSLTFGPIPVMKEKTFTALLYIEPIQEGLAVYCLAGAEVSDFIAKYVDISSALNKRMDVFVSWLLDGIN
ncbi:hypothetical protein AGMMS50230_19740 [Spirochaetia bacterium]|nr:hypothetical protein AGMMS50230_19740 [Spirochaetia bacterium]